VLRGRSVLLCVGGGIAAYKCAELLRIFVRSGASVDVAMTAAAQRFVTPLTFQALSQRPVATSLLDSTDEQQIGHIALADRAELVVVAPATADLLAKMRAGLADDLVTTTLLAVRAPVLVAPGMNVHMWQHPATRENVSELWKRGVQQVGPGSGSMACGHTGDGRLAEPWEIARAAAALLQTPDFAGKRVLVTAGPTREFLDPVRFLSNPSTGKMGYAIAREFARRGARVTLVSGPVTEQRPAGVDVVDIVSADELKAAVDARAETQHVIVMSAAVADQKPAERHPQKVKKQPGPESLALVRTPDVLAGLGAAFEEKTERPLLVGFAAETERHLEHARAKLETKRCDVIAVNDVGPGGAFGNERNSLQLVTRDAVTALPEGTKEEVARSLVDALAALLARR